MELTQEQHNIINSKGNIKINAVAGSGKTTTIIEYAKARPKTAKILYLAFNRSVKLEAQKKFIEKGLSNVKVETAHSLAYRHIVPKYGYKIRPQGYKTAEIAELMNIKGNDEKYTEYIVANHINKFISYFCNSDKPKVQDLNYLETISEAKAIKFVTNFYHYIEAQTRLLLSKMDKGEIDITHDFYLKKFQLSNPVLNYDYILFDEGQDASAAMLDVFLKQKATKVIVGDTHQQIYGWRYAVNSLEKADFTNYNLSTSFRFSQDIANLAMEILKWKTHISKNAKIVINGKDTSIKGKTKAVIARTNLGLLTQAIEYVTEKQKVKNIYFEGNINSYTYADDGASLYDVLNLYNERYNSIKDKLIRKMRDIEELEDYISKTEDVQLGMLVEIVKKYGDEIPEIISEIKEKHVGDDKRDEAEMVFSTVHRCKGMEYDAIKIVKDFITEEEIEKKSKDSSQNINKDKLNEEINLLYVAVTRAKKSIFIPEILMPKDFPKSSQINILPDLNQDGTGEKSDNEKNREMLKAVEERNSWKNRTVQNVEISKTSNSKTYSLDKIREKYSNAYKPWTDELDEELTIMYCEGVNINELAKHFGRQISAIISRIKKLELEESYGIYL